MKYICVYCGTETDEESCNECHEFDGLILTEEYEEEETEWTEKT